MRLDVKASAAEKDARSVRKEALMDRLVRAKSPEIDTYIDQHVTDFQSAKGVIKTLAKAVALLMRERGDK